MTVVSILSLSALVIMSQAKELAAPDIPEMAEKLPWLRMAWFFISFTFFRPP
jgi:hypothetical protein